MSERKIVITIDPLGNPRIEAQNFHGQGCAAATESIEKALAGDGGADRVFKPEWNEYGDAHTDGQQHVQW